MPGERRSGVLLLDSGGVLARALAVQLTSAGADVYCHSRERSAETLRHLDGDDFENPVCGERADDILATWDMAQRPIQGIVFGALPIEQASMDSLDDIDALAIRVENGLLRFLSELQAAGRLLVRHGGQIWVMTSDLGMRFCMPLDACCIETRAKQAAVKSFAKEVSHMGVAVNCASIQLLAEQAPPQQWRAQRDRLKIHAVRFHPPGAQAVARTLAGFLLQKDLPMSGVVVPIGIGMAEPNV